MKRRIRILSILLSSVITFTSITTNAVYNVNAAEESVEEAGAGEVSDDESADEESENEDSEDAGESDEEVKEESEEAESNDESENSENNENSENSENAESQEETSVEEAMPTEAVPTEVMPTEEVPTEAVPTEAMPTEAMPTDAASTEEAPTEAIPTETASEDEIPTESSTEEYTIEIPTEGISDNSFLEESKLQKSSSSRYVEVELDEKIELDAGKDAVFSDSYQWEKIDGVEFSGKLTNRNIKIKVTDSALIGKTIDIKCEHNWNEWAFFSCSEEIVFHISVSKKTPDIKINDIKDVDYSASPVAYGSDNIKSEDDVNYTFVFSNDEAGNDVIDAPVNAGEYYFVVKTVENERCNAVTKSKKFKIHKIDPEIKVTVDDAYEGEAWDDLYFDVESITGANGQSLDYSRSDFKWTKSGETMKLSSMEKVGKWLSDAFSRVETKLIYTPPEKYSKNYNGLKINVEFTIYKDKVASLEIIGGEKTYDGQPYDNVQAKLNGEDVSIDELINAGAEVSYYRENNQKLDGAPKDAGKYYVKVRLDSIKDERWLKKLGLFKTKDGLAGITKVADFEIKGKDLLINATPLDGVYNGDDQKLVDVTVDGVVAGDAPASVSYKVNDNETDIVPSGKNVGEYTVTVKADAGSNYNPASVEKTAKINKAELKVTYDPYKGVYDGKAHKTVSNISVKGVKDENVSFNLGSEVEDCSEPGEYKFDILVISNDPNYNNGKISGTAIVEKIKIDESKLSISANDIYYKSGKKPEVKVIYDGEELSPEAYAVSFENESFADMSVGTHSFNIEIKDEHYEADKTFSGSFNVVAITAEYFQKTRDNGGIKKIGSGYLTEDFYNNSKDSTKKITNDADIADTVLTAPAGLSAKHANGEAEYYFFNYNEKEQRAYVYLFMDYKPVAFYVRKSGVSRPEIGKPDSTDNYVLIGEGKLKIAAKQEGNEADDNVSDLILEGPDADALRKALISAGYSNEELDERNVKFNWYRVIKHRSGSNLGYNMDGSLVTADGSDYAHHDRYSVSACFTDGNGTVTVSSQTVYQGEASEPVVFTPNADYYISSVESAGEAIDISSVADGSYTFPAIENIESDVNITAAAKRKAALTITAASAEKVYDGKTLSNPGYTISDNGADYKDYITVSADGAITNVGTVENKVIYDLAGNDYRFSKINTVNGSLTVNKKEVSISVNNAYKTYGEIDPDSIADGYTVTGLVSDNDLGDIRVVRENSSEKTGSYEDVLNVVYTENPNYNVTVYKGDFVINKASDLKVTVSDQSVKYDGKAHSIPVGTEISSQAADNKVVYRFFEDASATKEIENSFTNAGTYNVWVQASDENHNASMAAAKIVIEPRTLTFTSGSAERRKNGKALTNSEVTITGDGFVNDEGVSFNVTGSQTVVGTSDNIFDYTLKANTLASNYSINKVYGKLTVNKKKMHSSHSDKSNSSSGSSASGSSSSGTAAIAASPAASVLGDREAPEQTEDADEGVLGDKESPNTGDNMNPVIWLTVFLASGTSILAMIRAMAGKKKDN